MAFNGNVEMTEVDPNLSTISCATTCFGGSVEPHIVELRSRRQEINADRPRLIADFKRLSEMNEDDLENVACDFDYHRHRWWEMVVNYVTLARGKFDEGLISRGELQMVANSLRPMTKTWNATRYFDNDNGYDKKPFPTADDVMKPVPQTGVKRQINDFSINTDVLLLSPANNRFRSSSPNPANDDVAEIVPDGNLLVMPPPSNRRRSLGAIGGNGRALPTPNNDHVTAWVNQQNGATPSPLLPPHRYGPASAARRAASKKEVEEAKKEVQEMKTRLDAADAAASLRLQVAVKEKEDEVTAKAKAYLQDEIEKERAKTSEFQRQLSEATQQAAAAAQQAAAIREAAATAQAAAEQRFQEDKENMGRYVREQIAAAQEQMKQKEQEVQRLQEAAAAADEARRNAEANAAEQRRMLESEKNKRPSNDILLPSTCAANPPTSTLRFARRKSGSSPRQVQHPLHAALETRQGDQEHCAMNITSNETTVPSSHSSNAGKDSVPSVDAIQRFMNSKGGVMDWSGVSFDNWVRVRQMDVDAMRSKRPKAPFTSGTPLEYARFMAKFEDATNRPTIQSKDKLEELAEWFSGDAERIISSTNDEDPDVALAIAKSELDKLFKGSKDTVTAIIQSIVKGKQLDENDHGGHLKLYAELKDARAVAKATGSGTEFNRSEVAKQIVNARLSHMANRYFLNADQQLRISGRESNIDDLMKDIDSWMTVLRSKFPNGFHDGQRKANVAAVASTSHRSAKEKPSYSHQLIHSPPQQQQKLAAQCNYCGSRHNTQECNALQKMTVEKRVEALTSKSLCYHCMCPGHRAKFCGQRPRCTVCSKQHATLLHDRKFQEKPPQSNLSANALEFRQMPTSTTAAPSGNAAASTPASTHSAVL